MAIVWTFKKLTEKTKKFRIYGLDNNKDATWWIMGEESSGMNFERDFNRRRTKSVESVHFGITWFLSVSYRYFLDTHAIKISFPDARINDPANYRGFNFSLIFLSFSTYFPLLHKMIVAISKSFIQNEVIKKVIPYILSIAIFN